jgi:Domain of unknown function (DUF4129)
MRSLLIPVPPRRASQRPLIERVAELLVVATAVTLETLPIFSLLLLLATFDTDDPNNAAMPFWTMWLLVFGVYWLAMFFSEHTVLRTAAVLILGTLSLIATYWVSPAARNFLNGGSDTNGPVGLALLVIWLWFRGLYLSRIRVSRERIYIRFLLALGGAILALAGVAALPEGTSRDLTATYLSLLLTLLLFVGSMGLTLAQACDESDEMRVAAQAYDDEPVTIPPVFTRSWLAASLGLSLGLSALALLLATLVSRQSVRTLAVAVGNIANGLLSAIEFILTPIFYVIYVMLDVPVQWLANFFRGRQPRPLTLPPPPPCPNSAAGTPAGNGTPTPGPGANCVPPGSASTVNAVPVEWLTALRLGTILLVVLVAVLLLARALSRLSEWRRLRAYSEERTMLDASEILGGQLRRFFDAFRRRRPEEAPPAVEELDSGTVRRLYRDILSTAAAMGRARRDAETPREYARRLISDPLNPAAPPPTVAGALHALTTAYEQARYTQSALPELPDSNASPPAPPQTAAAAEEVRRWLAENSGE